MASHGIELFPRELKLHFISVVEGKTDVGCLIRRPGKRHQAPLFRCGKNMSRECFGRLSSHREACLGIASAEAFRDVAEHAMVKVVTAQSGIAARGEHLKDAARQLEKRNVERAAAKVIDHVGAFGTVVKTVGKRGCRRFVEKTQNREVRKTRGILRRLPLRRSRRGP